MGARLQASEGVGEGVQMSLWSQAGEEGERRLDPHARVTSLTTAAGTRAPHPRLFDLCHSLALIRSPCLLASLKTRPHGPLLLLRRERSSTTSGMIAK